MPSTRSRLLARLLAIAASCLTPAVSVPAAPPRPEAVIGSLLQATGAKGTKGHQLPRALLAQLYANAIKLSDLSGAGNGTVLGGRPEEPIFHPVASVSASTVSLAATPPLTAEVATGRDKLWLCKRPVYPVALLQQYGIPLDVAEEVNARGYHAYVLHGEAPHVSLAYQFTSTNGWELWNKVLGILKEQGAGAISSAKLSKSDVAEWGKTMAAEIAGPAETSSAPGLKIFTTATQCWGSELPSRCSKAQMDEATKAYAARRPEFNLLSNNCARFACAMLAACGGAEPVALLANATAAGSETAAQCHPDACADNLMFEGPKGTLLAAEGSQLASGASPDAPAAAAAPEQLAAAQGVQGAWAGHPMAARWGQRALYPGMGMGAMYPGYS